MKKPESGFTIIEVMIALLMLTIGVLALSTSSGAVIKMMDSGRRKTDAAMLAQSVLDSLRFRAFATSPPQCGVLSGGSHPSGAHGFNTSWTVSGGGAQRNITVTVTYPVGGRTKTEITSSAFFCQ